MGNVLRAGKTALDYLLEDRDLTDKPELLEANEGMIAPEVREMLERWKQIMMHILEVLFNDGEEVREMFRLQEAERSRKGRMMRETTSFLRNQFGMTSQESFAISEIMVRLGERLEADEKLSDEVQRMIWEMACQLQENGKIVMLSPTGHVVLFSEEANRKGSSFMEALSIVPAGDVSLEELPEKLPEMLLQQNPYMGRSGMSRIMRMHFPSLPQFQEPTWGQQFSELMAMVLHIFPGMGNDETLKKTLRTELSVKYGLSAVVVAATLLAIWGYTGVVSPLKWLEMYEQIESGEKKPEDFDPFGK